MRTDELDFDLPQELIAQEPIAQRGMSRLLHYRRADRSVAHRTFDELPTLLVPGDLLVLNDSRVVPARFCMIKPTGGLVDALFLRQVDPRRWRVMLKNLGTPRRDVSLNFPDAPHLAASVIKQFEDGQYIIELSQDEAAIELLDRIGRMPLPPYIRRDRMNDPRDASDRHRYQTIHGRTPGSVAAPTAGLHFTEHLFAALAEHDVQVCFITLHVGLGTFKPVTAERLEEHAMHSEIYSISPQAARMLNAARDERRRIIAVGTTAARVLESQPTDRPFQPISDETDIFVYPPYQWKHVEGLITNFHLPRSTLIALVAALVGLGEQRRLYQIAIENRYRFFSYGDAMFIE